MEIKKSVIWITGASSGIGRALASKYHKLGAHLIISGRNKDALYALKEELRTNIDVHVLVFDLANHKTLSSTSDKAWDIYHKIDILVLCGGLSQRSYFVDTKIDVFKKLIDINLMGNIWITKQILPKMIEQGHGQIAVISSLVGKFGSPLRSAYAACKHALHGLFDSIRSEVFHQNIQISLVCPGFIRTNISINAVVGDGKPQHKMDQAQENGMDPDICAAKIIKAIKKKKEEVVIGGRERYSVLVKRFFPGLFSKMIRKMKVT